MRLPLHSSLDNLYEASLLLCMVKLLADWDLLVHNEDLVVYKHLPLMSLSSAVPPILPPWDRLRKKAIDLQN